MENFYYIDDSGFIDFAGAFACNEDADEFLENEQLNSFMLFSESYLQDFIKFADQMIKDKIKR